MLPGTALKLAVIVTGVRHVGAITLDNAILNRLTGMKGDDFGLDWSAGGRAPACMCVAASGGAPVVVAPCLGPVYPGRETDASTASLS